MEKVILKLKGIDNLDVRFFSLFLYNLKAYTTAITQQLIEEDIKIINLLQNIDGIEYTGKTIKNVLEKNEKLNILLNITNDYVKRKGKYNLFLSNQVKLEIIDIKRGSWELLMNLTPDQIEDEF